MSWTLRSFQIVTTWVIVVVWVALFTVALVTADSLPDPVAMVQQLAIPVLLWVVAARLVLRHWWSGTGSRMSTLDPPGRLLAVAVAALPERRREWGMAMTAELAEVGGRSARWRFALSSARATLWLRPAGGWPVLALAAALVVASVAAAGPAIGAAAPGLEVFAATFAAIFGALVLAMVARSTRVRVPTPTLLLTGIVAAAIAMTVVFLRHDPSAGQYLPAGAATFLALVLAGCLWVAVAAPTDRVAPLLGIGTALAYVTGLLLLTRAAYDPRLPHAAQQAAEALAAVWLVFVPPAAAFLAALAAGSIGRSFRSGLRGGLWAGTAAAPLAYVLWLHESLRMYKINGGLLLFGDGAPEAENLNFALAFCLAAVLILGPPFAVFGAATASRPNPTGSAVIRSRR